MNLMNSETEKVLEYFQQICQIPRRSGHEEEIRNWLSAWAISNKFTPKSDAIGNLLIQVPSSAGYESCSIVTLQCHMDMVCEKTSDSDHDFDKDALRTYFEQGWLTAKETTLGADNGIGIAIAMTVATSETICHPPLELLFTADEESGLTGVSALEKDFFSGKQLINLDSEEIDIFTIGCAGGVNIHISIPIVVDETAEIGQQTVTVEAGGMAGGHSGIEIHRGSANAIKVLADTLSYALEKVEIRITRLEGGTSHNVIPNNASCDIRVSEENLEELLSLIKAYEVTMRGKYKNTDSDLFLRATLSASIGSRALITDDTRKVVDFLLSFPHGISSMSEIDHNVVETSNNLAQVQIDKTHLKVLSSQRSFINTSRDRLSGDIAQLTKAAGGLSYEDNSYSAWQPDPASRLLTKSKKVYSRLFPNSEPAIELIHAGLECGVIGEKYPGIDMISMGPTIKYPHSPREKVFVPHIDRFFGFFVELLAELCDERQ